MKSGILIVLALCASLSARAENDVAKFIGAGAAHGAKPAYVRREVVNEKPVERATWRVTGLGVFTALGVAKGNLYHLGPIGLATCGVLSAVGGGILRDVMARRIPAVLVNNFYATASLIGGLAYIALLKMEKNGWLEISDFTCFIVTTLLVLVIRLLAIRYNFHLPGAQQTDKHHERE